MMIELLDMISLFWQTTVQSGAMKALFGKDSLQDFLHIDNLVQAHILAGQALLESRKSVAVSMQKAVMHNLFSKLQKICNV